MDWDDIIFEELSVGVSKHSRKIKKKFSLTGLNRISLVCTVILWTQQSHSPFPAFFLVAAGWIYFGWDCQRNSPSGGV